MAIQHIDVTLRDGGYRNQFHLDMAYAKAHVHSVASCGIEWLEIGYRNASFKPIEGIGITGLSPTITISPHYAKPIYPPNCALWRTQKTLRHKTLTTCINLALICCVCA